MRLTKTQLAIHLSTLEPLQPLTVALEQYATDSELAADLLWNAYLNGDIEGKTIADLGCGNGIFGIGALLLGAHTVHFVDIEPNAIAITRRNAHGKGQYHTTAQSIHSFHTNVDTVIMNPPFGVQQSHADKLFLERAMQISTTIYTIHKIESANFIEALACDHTWDILSVTPATFTLNKTYRFHTKKRYDVRIGIWILKKKLK